MIFMVSSANTNDIIAVNFASNLDLVFDTNILWQYHIGTIGIYIVRPLRERRVEILKKILYLEQKVLVYKGAQGIRI